MTSSTQKIVKAMKATGNKPGVIAKWKESLEIWANNEINNPDAVAMREWLPLWQVRPYYTAAELAPIMAALEFHFGLSKGLKAPKSVKRLENELDFYGLSHFFRDGLKFYLVEQTHLIYKYVQDSEKD